MADNATAVDLSARERQAIVGGLDKLSAQARGREATRQPVTGEEVVGLLEIGTDSYQFDLMNPEEIDTLCRISGSDA